MMHFLHTIFFLSRRGMDFRTLLIEKIAENRAVVGYKTKLARVADCQLSYLLQVIKGQARFSLDQAYEIFRFWQLDPIDLEIGMISVYLDRSKSPGLRAYYLEKIELLNSSKASDSKQDD